MLGTDSRRYRIFMLVFMFLLGLTILGVRLCLLYGWYGSSLVEQSEKNYTKINEIKPIRGSLVDVQGRPLATNEILFDLYWSGSESIMYEQSDLKRDYEIIKKIGSEVSYEHFLQAYKKKKQILLISKLSLDSFLEIGEVIGESSCITVELKIKRIYPHQSTASHLLGYVRQKQDVASGVAGLEKYLQEDLQGVSGEKKMSINARGVVMKEEQMHAPLSGKNIQLTIDLDLQEMAEKAFSVYQSGAIVIMDPENGAIKALVSYPNFDPNRFLQPLSTQEWQRDFQQQTSPLLNRATQGLYPAASLFKLVTFAAGLEEGIIAKDTIFECKGHFEFCGRKYYCQRSWGHGSLNTKDALAYSCNIPCYVIAEKMDIDILAWYAYEMGFGTETGLFLPEKSGLIPTKAWKQAVKHESWWQGETLSASIGQSFIMVTPLQVACMLGSIFTGYRVRPRVLTNEVVQKKPISLSEDTRLFLQESMALGVKKGTSRRLAMYDKFVIHAKTGTAQTSNLRTKKEKRKRSQIEHGWTAIHFKYKNDKPYILVVLVEHSETSRAATEIAQKILRQYGK